MSDETLPREELLRKMLNMTTSDNDGTALVAIRKANTLLAAAGWSWDKLLSGKIKIVESPFKNMPNPTRPERFEPKTPSPTPTRAAHPLSSPRSGCHWVYDSYADTWVNEPNITPPTPAAPTPRLGLTRPNLYARYCYCCGDYTNNNQGFIMKPRQFNPRAPDKWEIVCKNCNNTRSPNHINERPAMKNTGQTTSPAPDLGSL